MIKTPLLLLAFLFITNLACLSVPQKNRQDSLSHFYNTHKTVAKEKIGKLPQNLTNTERYNLLIKQSKASSHFIEGVYITQYCKSIIYELEYQATDSLLNIALSIFTKENCYAGLAETNFYIGARASKRFQTETLHTAFTKAAHFYSLLDDARGEVYSYNRLANHFSRNDNESVAFKYYKLALDRLDQCSVNTKEMTYLNVANFYNESSQSDKALEYYKILEESIKESNNTHRLKYLYNNLGVIYLKRKNWDDANSYLTKSLHIKEEKKDTLGILNTLQNLYRISLKTENLTSAQKIKNRMEALLKTAKPSGNFLVEYYYNLTEHDIIKGNKNEALYNFRHYTVVQDSFFNTSFSDKLIQLEHDYNILKQKKEISDLKQMEIINKAELKTMRLVVLFIGSISFVLIVLGLIMNRQWKQLKRSEDALLSKQREVTNINSQLKLSNQSKDRILSIIGHDLRGPVGGLKELIELYMELPDYDANDMKNLLVAARKSSAGTYHLLENLLCWANSQRGQIRYEPTLSPLKPLITSTVKLLDNSINTNHVRFNYNMDNSTIVNADVNMLKTIIRNIVSNAIKHSPSDSYINISVKELKNKITICVQDFGDGMSAEEAKSLFSKKETYYIESGSSASGTGLGLILCKEFVDRHKGQIWAETEKNKSTSICFSLPHTNKNINNLQAKKKNVSIES